MYNEIDLMGGYRFQLIKHFYYLFCLLDWF
jgi:hypothetical protein